MERLLKGPSAWVDRESVSGGDDENRLQPHPDYIEIGKSEAPSPYQP